MLTAAAAAVPLGLLFCSSVENLDHHIDKKLITSLILNLKLLFKHPLDCSAADADFVFHYRT